MPPVPSSAPAPSFVERKLSKGKTTTSTIVVDPVASAPIPPRRYVDTVWCWETGASRGQVDHARHSHPSPSAGQGSRFLVPSLGPSQGASGIWTRAEGKLLLRTILCSARLSR